MPKQQKDNPDYLRLQEYIEAHQRVSLPSANVIAAELNVSVSSITRWLYSLGWQWENGQWVKYYKEPIHE